MSKLQIKFDRWAPERRPSMYNSESFPAFDIELQNMSSTVGKVCPPKDSINILKHFSFQFTQMSVSKKLVFLVFLRHFCLK